MWRIAAARIEAKAPDSSATLRTGRLRYCERELNCACGCPPRVIFEDHELQQKRAAVSRRVSPRRGAAGIVAAALLAAPWAHAEMAAGAGLGRLVEAIHSQAPNIGTKAIVTAFHIDYLKKARGPLTATCRCQVPETSAKSAHEIEAVVTNTAGEAVCRARATWLIAPDKRAENPS